MLGLIERIIYADRHGPVMLTFTRLVETFLTCIVPSAITMFVLSKKPIINLMYAMYFAGMFICLCINGFFWLQFMTVIKDWGKFIKVNLGVYGVFAAAMIIGFYFANDPKIYTTFFGIYRALEFFDIQTIVSIVAMNILSIIVMIVAGMVGMRIKLEKNHSEHVWRRPHRRRMRSRWMEDEE